MINVIHLIDMLYSIFIISFYIVSFYYTLLKISWKTNY